MNNEIPRVLVSQPMPENPQWTLHWFIDQDGALLTDMMLDAQ